MVVARASGITPEQAVNDLRQNVGHFDMHPYARLGDADSAHQVMFGNMPDYGSVAVKPFSVHQRALREARNLQLVGEKGFDAIRPIVVAQGGLATYLITERRKGLRNLGQVNWRANVADQRLRSELVPALHHVAAYLGHLHNERVIHGDFQAKNAMHDLLGNPVFGDAEKAWVHPPAAELTRHGNKDVGLFGVSVLARGLLADRSPSYRAGFLDDELVVPYLEVVKDDAFTMDSDTRRLALEQYWREVIQRGHTPQWVRRQVAIQDESPST